MLDAFQRYRQRKADYAQTFSSEAGKRVLADLYRFCHMDQPSFAVNPFVTAFNEGQRRVFLRVMGVLRLTDADIRRMSMESDGE